MFNVGNKKMYESILMYYKKLHPIKINQLKITNNKVFMSILDRNVNIYEGFPVKLNHNSNKSIHKWYGFKDADNINMDNLRHDIEYCIELNNLFEVYLYALEIRGEGGRAYKVMVTNDDINYYIVDMREEEFFELFNNEFMLNSPIIEPGGKLNGMYTFYNKSNGIRLAHIEYSKQLKKENLTNLINEQIKYVKKNKNRALKLEDLDSNKYYLGMEKDNNYCHIAFIKDNKKYRISLSNHNVYNNNNENRDKMYHHERMPSTKVGGLLEIILGFNITDINEFIRRFIRYTDENFDVQYYNNNIKFIEILKVPYLFFDVVRTNFSIELCEIEESLEDKIYLDLEEFIDEDINLILSNAIEKLNIV